MNNKTKLPGRSVPGSLHFLYPVLILMLLVTVLGYGFLFYLLFRAVWNKNRHAFFILISTLGDHDLVAREFEWLRVRLQEELNEQPSASVTRWYQSWRRHGGGGMEATGDS
ncbi:hypothetical protein ACFFNY_09020 [Paenibacillus hodogayensis]|uniref:Uncharacterized protein n=1 Tax=Paenibacillus hodogayensis TaxID=279208 RepID=A0ABV5VTU7_9BACL